MNWELFWLLFKRERVNWTHIMYVPKNDGDFKSYLIFLALCLINIKISVLKIFIVIKCLGKPSKFPYVHNIWKIKISKNLCTMCISSSKWRWIHRKLFELNSTIYTFIPNSGTRLHHPCKYYNLHGLNFWLCLVDAIP